MAIVDVTYGLTLSLQDLSVETLFLFLFLPLSLKTICNAFGLQLQGTFQIPAYKRHRISERPRVFWQFFCRKPGIFDFQRNSCLRSHFRAGLYHDGKSWLGPKPPAQTMFLIFNHQPCVIQEIFFPLTGFRATSTVVVPPLVGSGSLAIFRPPANATGTEGKASSASSLGNASILAFSFVGPRPKTDSGRGK